MGFKRLYRDVTLNGLGSTALLPRSVRWRMLRFLGMDIKGWIAVSPNCWFGGTNITIGRDTTINYGVFFDAAERITIGERCDIGMESMICTSVHEKGGPERRAGAVSGSPVTIGDGTWIGTRAVILPGVTIGPGCIIAAGSVVTKDCEPHSVYAGNPAVLKGTLPANEPAGARA